MAKGVMLKEVQTDILLNLYFEKVSFTLRDIKKIFDIKNAETAQRYRKRIEQYLKDNNLYDKPFPIDAVPKRALLIFVGITEHELCILQKYRINQKEKASAATDAI